MAMHSTYVKFATATALSVLMAGCTPRSKAPQTSSIAQPRQPVIALALGGGGAKGFAHIGVIKVLESHGIRAQIITGTSAGSFVGALYASGKTPYQLQHLAQNLEESDIRDLTLSRQGFVLGQKLQDFVNQQVANRPIEQFPKRFVAVATALDSGKKIEFARGNAGQAVRASCSIPNVFVPATIAGKQYVDGGLVSPIPVETARKMGADIVIAVDISARPKTGQSSNFWGLLDQTLNIMGQSSINYELQQADVVIKPAVGHLGVLDLKARNQSILAGEQAAQQQMPLIKKKIADFAAAQLRLQPKT
jgi:NTE family protein